MQPIFCGIDTITDKYDKRKFNSILQLKKKLISTVSEIYGLTNDYQENVRKTKLV